MKLKCKFFFLCSNDIKQGHKNIALELVIIHVLASFGEI